MRSGGGNGDENLNSINIGDKIMYIVITYIVNTYITEMEGLIKQW